jgi:hypothetical protein
MYFNIQSSWRGAERRGHLPALAAHDSKSKMLCVEEDDDYDEGHHNVCGANYQIPYKTVCRSTEVEVRDGGRSNCKSSLVTFCDDRK